MSDEEELDLSYLSDPCKTNDDELDIPNVEFSVDEYQEMWKPWRRALILKLLGKSISYRVLEQRTKELWNLEWGCELIALEEGYFVARFFSAEDYTRVLEGGPWIILGHYLTVTKWKPNFRPAKASISSALVCVRLSGIPLEYFKDKYLMRIGSVLGRAVMVDNTATTQSRGRYARVCVELDLARPLLSRVNIYGEPQPLEYEGLHQICFACGQYGHRIETCCKNTSGVGQSEAEATPSRPADPKPSPQGPYGPWMLPVYRNRKKGQGSRGAGKPSANQGMDIQPRTVARGSSSHPTDLPAIVRFTFSSDGTGKVKDNSGNQGLLQKGKEVIGTGSCFSMLSSVQEDRSSLAEEVAVLKAKINAIAGPSSTARKGKGPVGVRDPPEDRGPASSIAVDRPKPVQASSNTQAQPSPSEEVPTLAQAGGKGGPQGKPKAKGKGRTTKPTFGSRLTTSVPIDHVDMQTESASTGAPDQQSPLPLASETDGHNSGIEEGWSSVGATSKP